MEVQDKIVEGNKLIAEFDGWQFKESSENGVASVHAYYQGQSRWIDTPKFLPGFFTRGLNYHESWDKLMPVVEKIETIKMEEHGYFAVHISSNSCTIEGTKYTPDLRDEVYHFYIYSATKINATWHAVKEFIKWHNQQNISI